MIPEFPAWRRGRSSSIVPAAFLSAFLCAFLSALPGPLAPHALAALSVRHPAVPLPQGEPVDLVLLLPGPPPAAGDLYYRPAGVRPYQRVPFGCPGGGAPCVVRIPADGVTAPGIEYLVRLAGAAEEVQTDFPSDPADAPRLLPVHDPSSPPRLRILSPEPGVPVSGGRLEVRIESDGPLGAGRREIALFLDDTDVTSLAEISDNLISFSTPLLPAPGSHAVRVAVSDDATATRVRSFPFEVTGKAGGTRVFARGGISGNYGRRVKSSPGVPGDAASGNLGLAFGAGGREWEANWNGVNVQYVKDRPGEDVTLASGFAFTLAAGRQTLELGDVVVRETSLSAPAFARRGIHAKLSGFGTEIRLFGVGTENVTGWKTGLGEGGRQAYGLSVSRPLLPGGRIPATLVLIAGKEGSSGGFNVAGTPRPPAEGKIAALRLAHSVGSVKLEGEVAGSRYDADTTDGAGDAGDVAGRASLSAGSRDLSATLGYFYYGPDFASIANPNFTKDREGLSLSAGTLIGPLSLSVSGGHERDNLEGLPSRPIVSSTSGTVSLSAGIDPWPSVSASFSRSVVDSRREPAGTREVDLRNDTASGSLTLSRAAWNVSAGGYWGMISDRAGDLDSRTRGVSLSGRFSPARGVDLVPSVSLTETVVSGVLRTTRLASLTGDLPFGRQHAGLGFQTSLAKDSASDGSREATVLNGSGRLYLNLHGLTKRWGDFGRQVLAFTAGYTRADDGQRSEDLTLMVTLNLFAPIDAARGF